MEVVLWVEEAAVMLMVAIYWKKKFDLILEFKASKGEKSGGADSHGGSAVGRVGSGADNDVHSGSAMIGGGGGSTNGYRGHAMRGRHNNQLTFIDWLNALDL